MLAIGLLHAILTDIGALEEALTAVPEAPGSGPNDSYFRAELEKALRACLEDRGQFNKLYRVLAALQRDADRLACCRLLGGESRDSHG